jgi:hypothetical protein
VTGQGSPERLGTFDLELYWPGVTPAAVEELARRVQSVAALMAAAGRPVRFLGATLSLDDEVCFLRMQATRSDVDAIVGAAELVEPRVSEIVIVGAAARRGPG